MDMRYRIKMRPVGLEPTHARYRNLNPARLPIPPPPLKRYDTCSIAPKTVLCKNEDIFVQKEPAAEE